MTQATPASIDTSVQPPYKHPPQYKHRCRLPQLIVVPHCFGSRVRLQQYCLATLVTTRSRQRVGNEQRDRSYSYGPANRISNVAHA